jgi:hypothetical protein
LAGIAIRGVITWNHISLITLLKGNIQTIIPERICIGVLAGLWAGEGECNLMPFFQFAGDNENLICITDATLSNKYKTNRTPQDVSFHFSTPGHKAAPRILLS